MFSREIVEFRSVNPQPPFWQRILRTHFCLNCDSRMSMGRRAVSLSLGLAAIVMAGVQARAHAQSGSCTFTDSAAGIISCHETTQAECGAGFEWAAGGCDSSTPYDGFALHVDKNAANADPSSIWSTAKGAFTELSDALAYVNSSFPASQAPVYVLVAEGIYRPDDATSSRNSTFSISAGVRVVGGFAGSTWEDALPYDRKPDVFETILTGDLLGNDNGSDFVNGPAFQDNAYHVVTFDDTATGEDGALEGVIVQHGVAGPTATAPRGGGVYVDAPGADVRIKDVRFRYCYAEEGGAVAQDDGELYLDNCRFKYNRAQSGGALAMWSQAADTANMYVRWTRFIENVSYDVGGAFSGVGGGSAHFMNCIFRHNAANGAAHSGTGDGGTIFASGGAPVDAPEITFGNCLIHEGRAIGPVGDTTKGRGGAIFLDAVNAEIRNCTIADNGSTAAAGSSYPNQDFRDRESGGIWVNSIIAGSPIVISNSILTSNGDIQVDANGDGYYQFDYYVNNLASSLASSLACGNSSHDCFESTEPWVESSYSSYDVYSGGVAPPGLGNLRNSVGQGSGFRTVSTDQLKYSYRVPYHYAFPLTPTLYPQDPPILEPSFMVFDLVGSPVVKGAWNDWVSGNQIPVDLASEPMQFRFFDGTTYVDRASAGAFQTGTHFWSESTYQTYLGYYFSSADAEADSGLAAVHYSVNASGPHDTPVDLFPMYVAGLTEDETLYHYHESLSWGDGDYEFDPRASIFTNQAVGGQYPAGNCFSGLTGDSDFTDHPCDGWLQYNQIPNDNCFFMCQSGIDTDGYCLDSSVTCVGSGNTVPEFCLGSDLFLRVAACDLDPVATVNFGQSLNDRYNIATVNDRLFVRATIYAPNGNRTEIKKVWSPPYTTSTLPDLLLDTSVVGRYTILLDIRDAASEGVYADDIDRRTLIGYEVSVDDALGMPCESDLLPDHTTPCCPDGGPEIGFSCGDNDNNGINDHIEIWADPSLDQNGNCILDSRELGCPKIDIVFVFDTSGSVQEISYLCTGGYDEEEEHDENDPPTTGIAGLINDLNTAYGVDVQATIMSVVEYDWAACNAPLTSYTDNCLGIEAAAGNPGVIVGPSAEMRYDGQTIDDNCCATEITSTASFDCSSPFTPEIGSATQDWALASILVARDDHVENGFGPIWRDGALKIIVPVSDDWPCGGRFHETSLDIACDAIPEHGMPFNFGCVHEESPEVDDKPWASNTPCSDLSFDATVDLDQIVSHLSIVSLLADTAQQNNVLVSPMISPHWLPCGSDDCGYCPPDGIPAGTSFRCASPAIGRNHSIDSCLLRLANAVSESTGGLTVISDDVGGGVEQFTRSIVLKACADTPCPDLAPIISVAVDGGALQDYADNDTVMVSECSSLIISGANTAASGLYYEWIVDDGVDAIPLDTLEFEYFALSDLGVTDPVEVDVTLRVTDASGCQQATAIKLSISDSTPTINLDGPIELGFGELGVFAASASSLCDDIVSIEWYFDDVLISGLSGVWPEAAVISTSFASSGTLKARAYDSDGDWSEATLSIAVSLDDQDGQLIPSVADLQVAAKYHTVELVGTDFQHASEISITNTGAYRLSGDIVLSFEGLLPTGALLVSDESPTTYDDIGPYITFVPVGSTIAPGEQVTKVVQWTIPEAAVDSQTPELFEFTPIVHLRQQGPIIISDPVAGIPDPSPDGTHPTEFLVRLREGEYYAYPVQARDPEGQPLQYVLEPMPNSSIPDGMGINYDTGLLEWLPGETFGGSSFAVRIVVSDGFADAEQTIRFEVDEVNQPPVFLSNYGIVEVDREAFDGLDGGGNPETFTLPVTVFDPDGDSFTVTASVPTTDMSYPVAGGSQSTIDITWDFLAFTDTGPYPRVYPITLTATEDNTDLSTVSSFYLRISDGICDAGVTLPEFDRTEAPTPAVQGQAWTYQSMLSTSSAGVSFFLETSPQGMTIDESTGLIAWTAPFNANPYEIVTVVASYNGDPNGTCRGQYSFNLEIEDRNAPPVLDQPIPTQYVDEGELFSFTVLASDIDNDRLHYRLLDPANAPDGLGIHADSGRITWSVPQDFVAPMSATASVSITIRVTDIELAALDVTVPIEVTRIDVPPVIRSRAPYAVTVGTEYQYLVDAFDPDGQANCSQAGLGVLNDICYELVDGPTGMAFEGSVPNKLTWNPTFGDIFQSPHPVEIAVYDGDASSEPATEIWAIDVRALDGGPGGNNNSPNLVINSIDQQVIVGNTFTINYTVSDPQGDDVTMQLSTLSGSTGSFDPGTPDSNGEGTAIWTPSAADVPNGTSAIHALLLTATDEFGLPTNIPVNNIPVYRCTSNIEILSEPVTTAYVNRRYEYIIDVLNLTDGAIACNTYDSVDATIEGGSIAPPIMSIAPYSDPEADLPVGVEQLILVWDAPTIHELGSYFIEIELTVGSTTILHEFAIDVLPEPPNVGPQITSFPPSTTLFVNEPFEFDLTALDPDHEPDELIWTLTLNAPPEFTTTPSVVPPSPTPNPAFSWTPDATGTVTIDIDVTDGELSDSVSVTLEVVDPINGVPADWDALDTLAPLVDIRFEPDIPGNPLLSERLPIDLDDVLDPPTTTTAPVGVVVLVSDDLPFLSTEQVTVVVERDFTSGSPTSVDLNPTSPLALVSASGAEAIGPNALKATASFNVAPATGVYRITATITDAAGKQSVATKTVSVLDSSITQTCNGVDSPSCPNLVLTALIDELANTLNTVGVVPEVEGVLDIHGFCEDLSIPTSQFDRYELAYRPVGRTDIEPYVFHTSYDAVSEPSTGSLGMLDTTVMPNGTYDVVLTGYALDGSSESTWETIIVTGDRKVGNFTIAFDDLQVPVVGIPATVTRSYDSRDKFKGDFGYGWQLGLASMTVQESYPVGYDWQVYTQDGFCGYEPFGAHTVSVNWPDGRVEVFRPELRGAGNNAIQGANIGGCIFYDLDDQNPVDFALISRGSSTLEPLGATPVIVQAESNELTDAGVLSITTYDVNSAATPWEPTGYLVTTQDGTKFEFTSDHLESSLDNPQVDPVPLGSYSLRSITDRVGNQIIFEDDGIRRGGTTDYIIRFERDTESDLITRVIDPEDNAIVYEYDENEDLVSVTDRTQHVTRFVYNNDHGLIDIIDPRGVRAARNIYDDDGKLITIIDAENNRTEFIRPGRMPVPSGAVEPTPQLITDLINIPDPDLSLPAPADIGLIDYDCGNYESILDPAGVSTVHCYNTDGNVTLTMTVGSGGSTDLLNYTVMTYDAEGRKTRTIDAAGRVSEVVYESSESDLVTEQRSGGRIVGGQLVDAKITRMTYNEYGQIETTRDPLNVQAVMDADAEMNPPPVEVSARFQYDPFTGAVEATYDAVGNVTSQTYHEQSGLLKSITDRNLKLTRFDYYEDGNIREQTDSAGNKTEFDYDLAGRRTHTRQTVYTDGVEVISETQTVYDESGRAVQQIDADGNVTTTVYNNIGKVESLTDPLGRVTGYEYDLRGNLVKTTYPNGSTEESTYDVLGRQVTSTDRMGRLTTYVYDERGNRVETLLPGGIRQRTEYDGVGRTKRTYQPTSDGSLPSVIVSEYFYEYDTFALSDSNAVMAGGIDVSLLTDSNDQVKPNEQWVVNYARGYGAATPTSSPPTLDTNPTAYLSITYNDLNGRTIKTRDARSIASGDEYYVENEYDINGRLERTVFPAAELNGEATYVRTEYDNGGRATARIDQKNRRTETDYDDVGRVSKIRNALQYETEYVYGPSGRLMTQFDALDRATSMTYDVLGRMASRTRPLGQTQSWQHDAVGNLIVATNFRGQGIFHEYDNMNNLDKKHVEPPPATSSALNQLFDNAGQNVPHFIPGEDSLGECVFQLSPARTELLVNCDFVDPREYNFDIRNVFFVIDDLPTYYFDEEISSTWNGITDQAVKIAPTDLDYLLSGASYLMYEGVFDDGGKDEQELWGIITIPPPTLATPLDYQHDDAGDLRWVNDVEADMVTITVSNQRYLPSLYQQLWEGASNYYSYDASGNRTQAIIRPNSGITSANAIVDYQYDELNRLIRVTETINGSLRSAFYGYDANGNRAWSINLNDTLTTYSFDRLNRLTRLTNYESTTSGAAVISDYIYTLDKVGNRTRVVEAHTGPTGQARQVDYTYDELDRLTREVITNDPAGKDGVIAYTYDAVGNRLTKSSTVPDTAALVTYVYDDNDRLITETRQETLAGLRHYNDGRMFARGPPASHRAGLVAAGPRTPTPSVWSGRIVIGVVATSACALLYPLSLLRSRRRGLGREKRRRRVWRGTISLFCLPLMLMGGETVLGLERDAQLYRSMQAAIAASIGWSDANDASSATITYQYDNDGNMVARYRYPTEGSLTYRLFEYNTENRLVRAWGNSTPQTTYVYGPSGIRRRKTQGNVTTRYLIDRTHPHAQVVAEIKETIGQTQQDLTYYTYGDDLLSRTGDVVAESGQPTDFSNAVRRQYHYDGQMSTRQLTDDAATPVVTDTYTYDAFGVMLDQQAPATGTSSVNPYLYNGEQYDAAAESYYLRARYYNQSIGRFINADPFDGVQSDPMSLHKYLYAHANPVMMMDPSGYFSIPNVVVSTAIMSSLSSVLGNAFGPIADDVARTFATSVLGARASHIRNVMAASGPAYMLGLDYTLGISRGILSIGGTASVEHLYHPAGGWSDQFFAAGISIGARLGGGNAFQAAFGSFSLKAGLVFGLSQPSDYLGSFWSISANGRILGDIFGPVLRGINKYARAGFDRLLSTRSARNMADAISHAILASADFPRVTRNIASFIFEAALQAKKIIGAMLSQLTDRTLTVAISPTNTSVAGFSFGVGYGLGSAPNGPFSIGFQYYWN